MKLLFIILIVFAFGQSWSQSKNDYVKTIERLWTNGKLTTKTSTDKTFVGSVTAYYHNDSLVLINSLTDAEAAGTETLYYIENGALKKVFIVTALLESNDKWTEFYSKHKSRDNCYKCHGNFECFVTEIIFGDSVTIKTKENAKLKQLTQDDKEKMLWDIRKTYEELKTLLKELK
jgi:hypothetical protein